MKNNKRSLNQIESEFSFHEPAELFFEPEAAQHGNGEINFCPYVERSMRYLFQEL